METQTKDIFGSMFKNNGEDNTGILKGDSYNGTDSAGKAVSKLPKFVPPSESFQILNKTQLKRLHQIFSMGGKGFMKEAYSPLFGSSILNSGELEHSYPCFISSNFQITTQSNSLLGIINETIKACFDDKSGMIVKRFQKNFFNHISSVVNESEQPLDINDVVEIACEKLIQSLKIKGEDEKTFTKDLNDLKKHLPTEGKLFGLNHDVVFQLLQNSISLRTQSILSSSIDKIDNIVLRLKEILQIEENKKPETRESLEKSFDFAKNSIDFDAIIALNPEDSGEMLSADRIQHILGLIQEIEKGKELVRISAIVVLGSDLDRISDYLKKHGDKNLEIHPLSNLNKGIRDAMGLFSNLMKNAEQLISAIREAEWEINAGYELEFSEIQRVTLRWRSFTKDELNFFPPVILIENSEQIIDHQIEDLSKMISGCFPIKVIGLTDVEEFKSNGNEGNLNPDMGEVCFRQDITGIAISHRNAYVANVSTASPCSLSVTFSKALSAPLCSVTNVLYSSHTNLECALRNVQLEIASRNWPVFTFDGTGFVPWGSRFNVNENEQKNNDWVDTLADVCDPNGNIKSIEGRFTFADHLLGNSAYQKWFTPLDSEFNTTDLIPLSEYLQFNEENIKSLLPFIYGVDPNGNVVRLMVCWPIILACKERLNYWQYLQESAGLNNCHVQKALDEAKLVFENSLDDLTDRLKTEHKKELEKTVKDATAQAMEHLADVLLDLDKNPTLIINKTKDITKVELTNLHQDESHAVESEQAPEMQSTQTGITAYIDTALCTSCNECTNMNDELFAYNEDKMAFIKDLKAGSFAQLVEAAELCPVGIIHPGSPVNVDEPGLDDLKERAKKFN